MNLLGWIKPEYIFQPSRLFGRMFTSLSREEYCEYSLAWGGSIRARPEDAIGRSLSAFGLYDIALSETLWRLVGHGETIIDAGANIGYTAALMAARLGRSGRVVCFEAHPTTFQELIYNVARVERDLPGVRFECFQVALSDEAGEVSLIEPNGFQQNRGSARVDRSSREAPERNSVERESIVKAIRLDDKLAGVAEIGLMKIDVEDHEIYVLEGSRQLLRERKIRDIVFEALHGYPTPVSEILEQAGYQIYEIRKSFFGPELVLAHSGGHFSAWEPKNFLATLQIERAAMLLKPRGWRILGAGA